MAKSKIGQRGDTNSRSGQKTRTPTSGAHTGSRAEPSHATQQKRAQRVKKAGGGKGA